MQLVLVSLLIDDYDKAIRYFTEVLDFVLISDDRLTETKRWVVVKPRGNGSCSILLARADGEEQSKFIGNQSGGRVFLFLHTDDITRDLQRLRQHNVKIVRGPVVEPYGTVLVFEDQYGNKWDLIQPGGS